MADLAYVDSADETGHSASDTDSEEDHTGMAKDEVDTGFLHDASSWLSSTKDVIANYSRSVSRWISVHFLSYYYYYHLRDSPKAECGDVRECKSTARTLLLLPGHRR